MFTLAFSCSSSRRRARAGVHGEPGVGRRVGVGFDRQVADGRLDAHVLVAAVVVLVHRDAAGGPDAGEEARRTKSAERKSHAACETGAARAGRSYGVAPPVR